MDSGASNPYSTPQAQPDPIDPPADSGYRSPLPPYTPARLFLVFAMITGGWLIIWAESHGVFNIGSLLFIAIPMFFNILAKVTNPHSQRTDQNFKRHHMILMVAGIVIFMSFLWMDVKIPPPVKAVLMQPATFVLGGLVCYGLLIRDWWRRRNNPPYQPKPHAELPFESPWKPLPRVQDS